MVAWYFVGRTVGLAFSGEGANMKLTIRLAVVLFFVMSLSFGLYACNKEKKTGKVVVIEKEFKLVKDGKYSFSLDVTGKVKNVGDVDLKSIVVTGYCRSCNEMTVSDTWYATEQVRSPEQNDVIGYLVVGDTAVFSFHDIAFYYTQLGEEPSELPEKLEVVIESFETVE